MWVVLQSIFSGARSITQVLIQILFLYHFKVGQIIFNFYHALSNLPYFWMIHLIQVQQLSKFHRTHTPMFCLLLQEDDCGLFEKNLQNCVIFGKPLYKFNVCIYLSWFSIWFFFLAQFWYKLIWWQEDGNLFVCQVFIYSRKGMTTKNVCIQTIVEFVLAKPHIFYTSRCVAYTVLFYIQFVCVCVFFSTICFQLVHLAKRYIYTYAPILNDKKRWHSVHIIANRCTRQYVVLVIQKQENTTT